jgi:hypothetical protein
VEEKRHWKHEFELVELDAEVAAVGSGAAPDFYSTRKTYEDQEIFGSP